MPLQDLVFFIVVALNPGHFPQIPAKNYANLSQESLFIESQVEEIITTAFVDFDAYYHNVLCIKESMF